MSVVGDEGTAPSAASLPTATMPGSMTIPPVQFGLVPVKVSEPVPSLTRLAATVDRAAEGGVLVVAADGGGHRPAAGVGERQSVTAGQSTRPNVPMPGLKARPLSTLMLTVLFWTAAELANCRVALVDRGTAGIGVGTGEGQRPCIDLAQVSGASDRAAEHNLVVLGIEASRYVAVDRNGVRGRHARGEIDGVVSRERVGSGSHARRAADRDAARRASSVRIVPPE